MVNQDLKLKVQFLKLKSAWEVWATEETLLARDAWVKGVRKPRDLLREEERPKRDVSLATLEREGLVEVLPSMTVREVSDLRKIPRDVDLIVIEDSGDWFAPDEILEGIAKLGKPIIAEWDKWGYAIHGRISKYRLRKFSKVKRYFTMGVKDLLTTLNALRGLKKLKHMKVLYIGRFPSHSVFTSNGVTFEYIREKFGTTFIKLSLNDYIKAIEGIKEDEVKYLTEEWRKKFSLLDGRGEVLEKYAKVYEALKRLLKECEANAVTVDCAALPNIDYVPCLAFSLLIDEGIPCGCEADLPALLTMSMLMGISNSPALMGNLNENVTHSDIESNIVVVNHDVVPTSLSCPGCKVRLRDFHATGKGLTPYVELRSGVTVTLAGLHWDMDSLWASKGIIRWTEDTVHCRISIGVEVENARKLSKEAFGHHVVLVYGDHRESLAKLADLLDISFYPL